MTFPKSNEAISTATYNEYARQFRLALTKFKSRHPDVRGLHPVLSGLLLELVAHKQELTWSTVRCYRAALRTAFSEFKSRNPQWAEEITTTMGLLNQIDSRGCKRRSERTSGKKMKKVAPKDHEAILRELRRRVGKSRYAAPTASAITILRLSGLRPIELRDVRVQREDASTLRLLVKNAKATQGRGLGPTRTLQLAELTADEVDAVMAWPAHRQSLLETGPWTKVQVGIAGYLQDAAIAALGSRRRAYPCLYSYRHQVAADLKSAGNKRSEVSAVMGHKTDLTAGRHYARRASGTGSVKVRPDETLVAQVRRVAKPYRCRDEPHQAPTP